MAGMILSVYQLGASLSLKTSLWLVLIGQNNKVDRVLLHLNQKV